MSSTDEMLKNIFSLHLVESKGAEPLDTEDVCFCSVLGLCQAMGIRHAVG